MEKSSKISDIKNRLPQMGLVDRFFYLVNELYQNYFDDYNKHHENDRKEQFFYEWSEDEDTWELRKTQGLSQYWAAEELFIKFLQIYGNSELREFILSEIKQIVKIFWKKYSFQLSFMFNEHITAKYYLSEDADFLLLAPFMFGEESFINVINNELKITNIEDRAFLLDKYKGALSEIRYRVKSDFVWDAVFEGGRTAVFDDVVFPERTVIDLNQYLSYLTDISEDPSSIVYQDTSITLKKKKPEKLKLLKVHPEKMVKLFSKVLNREANEVHLIRNFVKESFSYVKEYSFDCDVTNGVLVLHNREETIKICKVIVLMMKPKKMEMILDKGASLVKRVLISSFRKDGKNKRVGMSDNLKKDLHDCKIMSSEDLLIDIGFSTTEEFKKFVHSK